MRITSVFVSLLLLGTNSSVVFAQDLADEVAVLGPDAVLGGDDATHRDAEREDLRARLHDALELVGVEQQLLLARARPVDVDRRENTLFRDTPIEMDFHITGAFKFFINKIIHTAAGINETGSNNSQTTTFFNVSSRTEETFWFI